MFIAAPSGTSPFETDPAPTRKFARLGTCIHRVAILMACCALACVVGCTKAEFIYVTRLATAAAGYESPPPPSNTATQPDLSVTPVSTKANPPGLSLSTYTPTAAFLGNQIAIVGGATGTSTNPHGSILVRETNCSLTQYDISYGSSGLYGSSSSLYATLPNADAYLHQISRLTTTAGCIPERLQQSSPGHPVRPLCPSGARQRR